MIEVYKILTNKYYLSPVGKSDHSVLSIRCNFNIFNKTFGERSILLSVLSVAVGRAACVCWCVFVGLLPR